MNGRRFDPNRQGWNATRAAVAAAACLFPLAAARAQEHEREAPDGAAAEPERHAPLPRRDPFEGEELREILEGLRHGMAALRALGDLEEVEHLERVAAGLHARARGRGGEAEREAAARQLDAMKLALDGLREAERGDAAERMQHAILAREFTLARRDDPEARRIRETAPTRGQLAELLQVAADAYREFGAERKAAIVGGLAREVRGDRDREGRPPAREREERQAREGRERRSGEEGTLHRIEGLEERLRDLENALENLQEEIRSLKRRDR